VTTLVDALEAQGLVGRGRHPTDRRATLVALTDQGRAAADRMNRERHAAAQELFADLPDADLAGFVAVADRVLDRLGGPAATEQDLGPEVPGIRHAPVP
jgi:DNA-binding MarR family transcriptional regulator